MVTEPMRDLVSVYIPTHNRGASVEAAVRSVLTQTWRQLEVIVVIDGSVDDSLERLQRLAAADARLTVIHHATAKGAPHARNTAIRAARGEFVTGLDDDDEFLRSRVECFVRFWRLLEAAGEQPTFLYAQDLFNTGRHCVSTRKNSGVGHADLMFVNGIGNQVFTRRESMLAAGGYDELMPAWQDLELWLRLTKHLGAGRLLDAATMKFNDDDRPDRISKARPANIRAACLRVIEKHASTPEARLALYAQYIGPYYGFRIGLREMRELLLLAPCISAAWRFTKILKARGWQISARNGQT